MCAISPENRVCARTHPCLSTPCQELGLRYVVDMGLVWDWLKQWGSKIAPSAPTASARAPCFATLDEKGVFNCNFTRECGCMVKTSSHAPGKGWVVLVSAFGTSWSAWIRKSFDFGHFFCILSPRRRARAPFSRPGGAGERVGGSWVGGQLRSGECH